MKTTIKLTTKMATRIAGEYGIDIPVSAEKEVIELLEGERLVTYTFQGLLATKRGYRPVDVVTNSFIASSL